MLNQLIGDALTKMPKNLNVAIATESPKAANDAPKLTVERMDNHVYFYSDVDTDRCLALIRTLRETDNWLRQERLTRELPDEFPPQPIWLHIHSGGGDLFAGLTMVDQLPQIKTPIYSIVEGMSASAATLISMACTRRYITPSSFMLIHQFSTVAWGTHETFKDEMKLQEMLMEQLVNFYVRRSKLDTDTIRDMLKHDSWMSSQQAVDQGFADAIRG